MAGTQFYRGEADRCRELAAAHPDSESASRWRRLAIEYDQLADSIEPQSQRNGTPQRLPTQQRGTRQQQSKAGPDET